MTSKDVVVGLGEIGMPIMKLISKATPVIGYDINSKLVNKKKIEKFDKLETNFLHICIPFSKEFLKEVISLSKKFKPKAIVIHSTISPYTTEKLQHKLSIPIIYSATRGIHRRMLQDLKKYTKFFSIYNWAPQSEWASKNFSKLMKKALVKTKKMSDPLVLEFSKIIVDTSYYAWLINYAQLSNMIAIRHKIDYDEMWSFADEIQKHLGNRPKMYPGYIGGHCVIPNLDLIHDNTLNLIKTMNNNYLKKVKNSKKIYKKYESKQGK